MLSDLVYENANLRNSLAGFGSLICGFQSFCFVSLDDPYNKPLKVGVMVPCDKVC